MDIDREAIIRTFLAESEEGLAAMEQALLGLESHPDDLEALGTIFRAAHTLKGNASSLGFQDVAEFAHVVEDTLDQLRSRALTVTGPRVTLLLGCVDALREMVPAAASGSERTAPRHGALLKRLRRAAGKSSGRGARPTAVAPACPAEPRRSPGRRAEDQVGAAVRGKTLRVDIERLDRLLNLTGELAISRGRLLQVLASGSGAELAAALELHGEGERLYAELQELVMQMRMVAVGPTFHQYVRTVRDQATSQGKLARLVLEGEDVEVDTKVIEQIRDPLTHMIRNALDHGIEPPEVRGRVGKDPCGTVRLRAYHAAGSVLFEVSDDGAGLSRERIIERARAQGLVGDDERITPREVQRLIFEPGLSTAESVTALSGRGVGLDVVRRNVEGLRGTVGVYSEEGRGTTITVRLPLTLAIIPGFGVGVGGETYVVPLDAVVETLEAPRGAAGHSRGSGVIDLRGEPLPYVRLREQFGLGGARPPREYIVVVQQDGTRAGLAVEALLGESQTVIKPLGRLLQGLPGIAGSAILGNGRVALILDVPAILREAIGEARTIPGTRVGYPTTAERGAVTAERERLSGPCERLSPRSDGEA